MSVSTLPRKKTKITAATAILTVLVAGGGAAFAFWTAQGTGPGTATTGTTTDFLVTSTTAGTPLTPGGAAQTITFTVSNPGSATQRLTTITPTLPTIPATPPNVFPSNSCTAADYLLGTPVFTPGDIAPQGQLVGTLTITMVNTAFDQNGCKNLAIPVQIAAG